MGQPYTPSVAPVTLWGLPLLPVTLSEAVDEVEALVEHGEPGFFITANLHYAMLTDRDERLQALNRDAAFIVADGMPMVWASRFDGAALPERVAGSDMIYAVSARAARRGYRVFFLGGAPGVGAEAAEALVERYPGLQIAGIEVPPFRELSPEENTALVGRIRDAQPDILFVALGQPKGELWIHENYRELGVPACVQLGASFDFVAGRVRRAPRPLQRVGMEWIYRIYQEPRRMAPRYFHNAIFLAETYLRRGR